MGYGVWGMGYGGFGGNWDGWDFPESGNLVLQVRRLRYHLPELRLGWRGRKKGLQGHKGRKGALRRMKVESGVWLAVRDAYDSCFSSEFMVILSDSSSRTCLAILSN